MARADRLKAEGVRERAGHEAEMKQLLQTMKVASADSDDQMRDGTGLGGLFSTRQPSPKKGLVCWVRVSMLG